MRLPDAGGNVTGTPRMKATLTTAALVLLSWLAARADIIPPGYKRVVHRVEFTNIAAFTNHQFFVYPRDLSRDLPGNSSVPVKEGGVELSALNPLAVGMNQGAYLYAIPKDLCTRASQPLEAWFTNQIAGVLKSPRLANPVKSLPDADPRDQILTRYRIEGMPARLDLIELAPRATTPQSGPAMKKSEASVLLGMSTVGAVLIGTGWRRRRSNIPAG